MYLVEIQDNFSVISFNSLDFHDAFNALKVCLKASWDTDFLNRHATGTILKPSKERLRKENMNKCFYVLNEKF